MTDSIGFLGGGKMAEALIRAILKEMVAPEAIWVCERIPARRDALSSAYGIRGCSEPDALLDTCDTLVLAVKPQDMDALLVKLSALLRPRHLLISIAAGKTLAGLRACIGNAPARLVRVMPNLAVQVGEGMSVYCLENSDDAGDARRVERWLGAAGQVCALPEANFDVVTALSGSGPAFLAHVVHAMVASAEAQGLDPEAALKLAAQTMLGTAKVLLTQGVAPLEFVRSVASPGGTTAAGLALLEKSDLAEVLDGTLRAAARRSRELSAS